MHTLNGIPENNLLVLRVLYNQLPQKYIANHVGLSQSTYCKMENAILPIGPEIIDKLNDLYDIDVNDILYVPKPELWLRMLQGYPACHTSLLQKIDMEIYNLRRR